MMLKLWNLGPRERGRVVAVDESAPRAYQVRLYELGVQSGTEVNCLRASPFGGPKSFWISDSVFSFDEELARYVSVELIPEETAAAEVVMDPHLKGSMA